MRVGCTLSSRATFGSDAANVAGKVESSGACAAVGELIASAVGTAAGVCSAVSELITSDAGTGGACEAVGEVMASGAGETGGACEAVGEVMASGAAGGACDAVGEVMTSARGRWRLRCSGRGDGLGRGGGEWRLRRGVGEVAGSAAVAAAGPAACTRIGCSMTRVTSLESSTPQSVSISSVDGGVEGSVAGALLVGRGGTEDDCP